MSVKTIEINNRKIYYVDVGDMSPEEAIKYLNKIKQKYKQKS